MAGLVLAALVLVAALTSRRSLAAATALAVLGVLWLLVNKPVEGATLLPVAPGRGVTTADLAGVATIAAALVRAALGLQARRQAAAGRR